MRLDVDVADIDLAKLAATIAEILPNPPPRRRRRTPRRSPRRSPRRTGKLRHPRPGPRAAVPCASPGTAQRPQLTVAAAAVKLRVGDHAIGDVRSTSRATARARDRQADQRPPTHTRVDVTMPLSLRDLVRAPPTAAALMRTPFQIRGDVDRLPLAALARVARYGERVGGTLSSHIELRGPAANPSGTVTFDVAGATSGRFPPTDARVELDVEQRTCGARVRVTRKARPLLALQASLELPVAAARDREALAAAPLRVRAVVGPLSLQRLGLPPETDAPRRAPSTGACTPTSASTEPCARQPASSTCRSTTCGWTHRRWATRASRRRTATAGPSWSAA